MFDALIELARRSLDTGRLPAGHGIRPHLAVIVSLDTLQHKVAEAGCGWAPTAPGELGWGGPISAAAVRRIGCDAGITRIITDPAGVPLDVGRESRTVTAGQWAALVVRDRGCAFPGCTRPPDWCQAHHIQHRADGGATDLDNLVLLCGHHHRVIHHSGCTTTTAHDRLPEFIPPPWIHSDHTPRRNTRPRYERSDPSGP